MKPDSSRLYLAVMEHIFNANEIDREAEIESLGKEINKKAEMLSKATMKFVNDELDKDNYNKLKEVLQNEMANLKAEILEVKGIESGFMECMTYGITFLSKLPHYYSTATLNGKQMILGSIFPEKLIFSENTYRTAEPNEIVDFLANIDGALKSNENSLIPHKSDFSCRVPGVGIQR